MDQRAGIEQNSGRKILVNTGVVFCSVAIIALSVWVLDTVNNPHSSVTDSSTDIVQARESGGLLESLTNNGNEFVNNVSIEKIKTLDAHADRIPESGRLVVVDLGDNSIKMYEDGSLVDETSLISQGQLGSFWQTPTGYYTITYTNPNHVSSIGNVNMPYSLQFSGNFFIHGWPTYMDGSDVPLGYSGGCIRLGTDNAERVFDFAPSGSKVLVVNSNNLEYSDETTSNQDLNNKQKESFPDVVADNVLVAHLPTGEILATSDNNLSNTFDLGSIGNFIMAMTANEWISYATNVKQYSTDSNGNYYQDGTQLVPKGLYPFLLNNDYLADEVNYALTKHRGEKFFAEKVTDKLTAIGMSDTEMNYEVGDIFSFTGSTKDLFHLGRYLQYQKRFLLEHANGVTITDDLIVFKNLPNNTGLETGFAIYQTDKDSDPYLIILKDVENFDSSISDISDWLESLNN